MPVSANRLKVLQVLPFDHMGSIQRRSLKVAEALLTEKVETVFVVPQEGGKFTVSANAMGFRVYKTESLRPFSPEAPGYVRRLVDVMASLPRSMTEFKKIVDIEVPNIIHVTGFVSLQEALIASLLFPRRFLWNLIGNIYPRTLVSVFSPIIRRARKRVFVASSLMQYYYGSIADTVVYEPVDTKRFRPKKTLREIQAVKKEMGLEETDYVIGFVGAIAPVKGVDCLIEAFGLVTSSIDKVKLLMVGEPPKSQMSYANRIHTLVHELNLDDNIIFTGYVENTELPKLLRVMDLFVLASRSEGTPVSILEAMSTGIPVVASRVGGVPEQVVDGVTGVLVRPCNLEALSNAILRILENKERRRYMGTMARQMVKRQFTLDECTERFLHIYNEMTQ